MSVSVKVNAAPVSTLSFPKLMRGKNTGVILYAFDKEKALVMTQSANYNFLQTFDYNYADYEDLKPGECVTFTQGST